MKKKYSFLQSLWDIRAALMLLMCVLFTSYAGAQNISQVSSASTVYKCSGSTSLDVTVVSTAAAPSTASVTIDLADGMQYVAGSLTTTAASAGVTIAQSSIADLNVPKFTVSGITTSGQTISFRIFREAQCAVASSNNSDVVKVTHNAAEVTKTGNTYVAYGPTLSFLTPAGISSAEVNTPYTRTLKVTNGSNIADANSVFLKIVYPSGITNQSLKVGTHVITPVSVSGTTYIYEINGDDLGSDNKLTNGETINILEEIKVNSCSGSNLITTYSMGWGCSATDAAKWCQTLTGTSAVAMATGNPVFNTHNNVLSNYTSLCQPFTVTATYKNSGTGNVKAATFYDLKLYKGSLSSGGYMSMFYNDLSAYSYTIISASVNGNNVPVTNNNAISGYELNNLFTTDPDGAGVGLEDVDGDGYYDDLPPGNTVSITLQVKFDPKNSTGCNRAISMIIWGGQIQYRKMCSSTRETTLTVNPTNPLSVYIIQGGLTSYMPANIQAGTSFNARLGIKLYIYANSFHKGNSRWVYEVSLPDGLQLKPGSTVYYTPGTYPNSNTPIVLPAANISQVGNVLSITSTNNTLGYLDVEFLYTCPAVPVSTLNIDYKLNWIENINSTPLCKMSDLGVNLGCATMSAMIHGCATPCVAPGVSTSMPVFERMDNSLGWTDATMTTRQSRANISFYDLAKALYMDEVELTATATQYVSTGTMDNLHARLLLNASANKKKLLLPLDANYKIIRGGTVISTGTIAASAATDVLNAAGEQQIEWHITGLALENNDKVELKSRYRVITNDELKNNDVLVGKNWNFYNVVSSSELFCNNAIPELYLAGTYFIIGTNAFNITECTASRVGIGGFYIARRFLTSGMKYQKEFKPSMYINDFSLTVPDGYRLVELKVWGNDPSYPEFALTPTISVNVAGGTRYTFTNSGAIKAMNTTVENDYGVNILPVLQRVCTNYSGAQPPQAKLELNYRDFYYYSYDKTDPAFSINNTTLKSIIQIRSGAVSLTNLTGTVVGRKAEEYWTVKITNTGDGIAPYVWLAIPDKAGITITKVTNSDGTTTYAPLNYTGGKLYRLNDAGMAAGTTSDYRVYFTYTTCESTDVTAYAGANCVGYPNSPDDFSCAKVSTLLGYQPAGTSMELVMTAEPTTADLCSESTFGFYVNNKNEANILDPKFALQFPVGMNYVSGSFEIQYPSNSGTWETYSGSPQSSGGKLIFDLLKHSAFLGSHELPGSIQNPQEDGRRINIRFRTNTSCEFVSGRPLRVETTGETTCHQPIVATGSPLTTSGIKINGVSTYQVNNELTVSPMTSCFEPITLTVKNIISSATPIGNTGSVEVVIPPHYKYVTGSFDPQSSGVTLKSVSTDSDTKITTVTLGLPSGLGGGTNTTVQYTLKIQEDTSNPAPCEELEFMVISTDEVPNMQCGGTTCANFSTETERIVYKYTPNKRTLQFGTVTAANTFVQAGKESVTATFDLKNISTTTMTNDITLNIVYDANGNGVVDAGETVVASTLITDDIPANGQITKSFTFDATSTQAKHLLLSINTSENCICSSIVKQIPITKITNVWFGTDGTVWDTPNNWVANLVPGAYDDVVFATEANNPTVGGDPKSGKAINDLYVPTGIGNAKIIGSLINASEKNLVVPPNASLTITGKVDIKDPVTGLPSTDPAKLQVQAAAGTPNGTLIIDCANNSTVSGPNPIYGTVQLYGKGVKKTLQTWTDNIVGSPTNGKTFTSEYEWQYFGVPMEQIQAEPSFYGAKLRKYYETINNPSSFYYKWEGLTNSSVLRAFEGYSITQPTATTYTLQGKLQFCDKDIVMTRRAPAVAGATGLEGNVHYALGQNIFGNSFTAALDINKMVFPAEVEKTVYLYNTGRFYDWATTGNLTTGSAPQLSAGNYLSIPQNSATAIFDNQIPSLQGFLLKFTDAETKFNFPDATVKLKYANGGVITNTKPQLVKSDASASSQEPLEYLRINLESQSTRDAVWLISKEGTTENFDNGWDGRKYFGTPTAFIFTENKDGLMQVNADKTIDGSIISFYSNGDTEYELTLIKSNLGKYTDLHLIDLQARTSTPLTQDVTHYSFKATKADATQKRFMIVNNSNIDFDNYKLKTLDAYLQGNNTLVVTNLTSKSGVMYLYDTTGRCLISQDMPLSVTKTPLSLSPGVYIVTMFADSKKESVKLIIK